MENRFIDVSLEKHIDIYTLDYFKDRIKFIEKTTDFKLNLKHDVGNDYFLKIYYKDKYITTYYNDYITLNEMLRMLLVTNVLLKKDR